VMFSARGGHPQNAQKLKLPSFRTFCTKQQRRGALSSLHN
jgi:hypothetical protein